MKSFEGLNKAFENRTRLGIMTVLLTTEWVDFTDLKDMLKLTDGNLSSHLAVLVKHKYVKMRKRFRRNKPNTSYCITDHGRRSFQTHIEALEAIVKMVR